MAGNSLKIPGCEISFIPSGPGEYQIRVSAAGNPEVDALIRRSGLGRWEGDIWLFPMTAISRDFLLSLPMAEIVRQPPAEGEMGGSLPYVHVLAQGRVCRRYDDGTVKRENALDRGTARRLEALLRMKTLVLELHAADMGTSGEFAHSRRMELNAAYEAFVGAYGPVDSALHRRLFHEDPQAGVLWALERKDASGHVAKGALLSGPVMSRPTSDGGGVNDALNLFAVLSTEEFAKFAGIPVREAEDRLIRAGLYFDGSNGWIPGGEYLSGDISAKCAEVEKRGAPVRNLAALKSVMPAAAAWETVDCLPGMPWLGGEVHQDFVRHLFRDYLGPDDTVSFRFLEPLGIWDVRLPDCCRGGNRPALSEWGLPYPGLGFARLFEDMVQHRPTLVRTRDRNGVSIPDEAAMAEAESVRRRIEEAFRRYILEAGLKDTLLRQYEERFPTLLPSSWDGSFLSLPGMSSSSFARLYPHQRNAIRRALRRRTVLFAHEVGAGKTEVEIASAMELIRLRLASRALLSVPAFLMEQIHADICRVYPLARILPLASEDVTASNADRLRSICACRDIDIILISHEAFSRLGAPGDFLLRMDMEEAANLEARLNAEPDLSTGSRNAWLRRISALRATRSRKPVLSLTDLKVDCLIIDEAHRFKNLFTHDKGVGTENPGSGSERAAVLYEMSRYLQSTGGRLLLASATPLSNTSMELYNLQRYLQPEELKRMGVETSGAWLKTFMRPVRRMEPSPDGLGVRGRIRYRYVNSGMLFSVFALSCDDVRLADCPYVIRPHLRMKNLISEASPRQRAAISTLKTRAAEGENALSLLALGRMVSLFPPLLKQNAFPLPPDSKVHLCADKAAEIYRATSDQRGTQLIFADLGTPKGKDGRLYGVIRDLLVERGIPEADIAFIHDARNRVARENMFAKLRAGRLRIGIGSTATLGEGANVQERLVAVHNLDCPWRPKDWEQRIGRMYRQGNLFTEVTAFNYCTAGTLDVFCWGTIQAKLDAFGTSFHQEDDAVLFSVTCEDILLATSESSDLARLRGMENDAAVVERLRRERGSALWPQTMNLSDLARLKKEISTRAFLLESLPREPEPWWRIPAGRGVDLMEAKPDGLRRIELRQDVRYPPESWYACRETVKKIFRGGSTKLILYCGRRKVVVPSPDYEADWILDCGGNRYISLRPSEIPGVLDAPSQAGARARSELIRLETALREGTPFFRDTFALDEEWEMLLKMRQEQKGVLTSSPRLKSGDSYRQRLK